MNEVFAAVRALFQGLAELFGGSPPPEPLPRRDEGLRMDDARRIPVQDFTTTISYIPHFIGALVILLGGGFIARLLGRITTMLLSELGLEALGQRTGLTGDLAKVGIQRAPPASSDD